MYATCFSVTSFSSFGCCAEPPPLPGPAARDMAVVQTPQSQPVEIEGLVTRTVGEIGLTQGVDIDLISAPNLADIFTRKV